MLRYLLLIASGGVYSDIDTRALMPLARWAEGAELFAFAQSRVGASLSEGAVDGLLIPCMALGEAE